MEAPGNFKINRTHMYVWPWLSGVRFALKLFDGFPRFDPSPDGTVNPVKLCWRRRGS